MAEMREQAEAYLQDVGLVKLCPPRACRTLGVFTVVSCASAIVIYVVAGYVVARGRTGWEDAALTVLTWLSVLTFVLLLIDASASSWSRSALDRGMALVLLGIAALAAIPGGPLVGRGSVFDGFGNGHPKTYNLALVLLAALVICIFASGGRRLVTASLRRAIHLELRDLRAAVAAMPEMIFVVAFVVIIGDVWKTLAPLSGWRVEVVLIACAILCATALAYRFWSRFKTVWDDPAEAIRNLHDKAEKAETPGEVEGALKFVEGCSPDPRVTLTMSGGAKANVALLVLLPLLVRLLIAAAVLTCLLFCFGLLVMDPDRIPSELRSLLSPGHQAVAFSDVAVGAAKVAAILSGLATVVFAVRDPGRVLWTVAHERLDLVRAGVAVWALHVAPYDRRRSAPAMIDSTTSDLASA